MVEAQHHRYSASGSYGWLVCAGKSVMEDGIPDTFSPYADEGSAAHFLAAECLTTKLSPDVFKNMEIVCWQKEGERDGQEFGHRALPEGAIERSRWTVTQEMVDLVTAYVDFVRKKTKDGTLLVEQRVHFGNAVGLPGAFGTADAVIVRPHGRTITIGDLKFGRKPVSAVANPQEMLYALGVIDDLDILYDMSKVENIEMFIFQPRLELDEPSEWSCSIEELREFAEKARAAITKSEKARTYFVDGQFIGNENCPNYEAWVEKYLRTSDKGCEWCRAKATCPALATECITTLVPAATTDDLPDLTLEEGIDATIAALPSQGFRQTAEIYKVIPRMKLFMEAIEAKMLTDMLEGEKHPDFKLVRGKGGHRAWKDEAEVEAAMKAMRLKTDEMYDSKLISPAKAEALLKKRPRLWKKLSDKITRSEGKPQVVPRSDKRPSINPFDEDLVLLPEYRKIDINQIVDEAQPEIDPLLD